MTPTTPTECRAEQERVLKLLSNADTPESWYYQPGWGLQKHNADGLGLIAGQSDFATHGDLLLLEAAPTLARAYAALLAAHAEALAGQQWVSVDERLPNEGEDVWFYTASGNMQIGSLKGGFMQSGSCLFDTENVTHWQPLPAPPHKVPQAEDQPPHIQ